MEEGLLNNNKCFSKKKRLGFKLEVIKFISNLKDCDFYYQAKMGGGGGS